MGALLFGSHPFWAMYENFWVALMQGLTNYQSYKDSYRVRLAHVYAVVSLFMLVIAVGYWKMIHLIG